MMHIYNDNKDWLIGDDGNAQYRLTSIYVLTYDKQTINLSIKIIVPFIDDKEQILQNWITLHSMNYIPIESRYIYNDTLIRAYAVLYRAHLIEYQDIPMWLKG
jgi:hypothetical protein